MNSVFSVIKRLAAVAGIVCLWMLCTNASNSAAAQNPPPIPKPSPKPKYSKITSHVVLISIGGLQGLCITNPGSCQTPMITLQRWKERGSYALVADSVYPSETLPAHATVLTGRLPQEHKVFANQPPHWISANLPSPILPANEPTLAGLLDKSGLQTCAVGFPLADADPAIKRIADFSVITNPNPRNPKDSLATAVTRDRAVLNKALEFINEKPAHLLMVYFNALDVAQQVYGLNSDESAATKREIDNYLEKIASTFEQKGLFNETTFIVISDRGAVKAERVYFPNEILARKGWLKVDKAGAITEWRAIVQAQGGAARVFVKKPQDEKDVLALFSEEHAKPDSPIWRIVTKQEATKLGADDQAAFYLESAPEVMFGDEANGTLQKKSMFRSISGNLSQRTEMRGAFLLYGKAVKPGSKFDYARLTSVAPTIARLLGLEMRVTHGRVLSEALTQ